MGKTEIGNFVLYFVMITIAIGFIIVIANQIAGSTQPNAVTNETLNIAPARLGDGSINETYPLTIGHTNWVYNSVSLSNATETALTENTDYRVDYTNEFIYLNNTAAVQQGNATNITKVAYSFKSDIYIEDSSSRAMIKFILILSVIGILIISLKLVYSNKFLKQFFKK